MVRPLGCGSQLPLPPIQPHPRTAAQGRHSSRRSLRGSEYEVHPEPEDNMTPVCSVSRTARAAIVMVPATNICHPSWQLECSGYLMAGAPEHHAASEYICVDRNHGYIPGTQTNLNGKLLYYTIARCGSLSSPPTPHMLRANISNVQCAPNESVGTSH